MLSKYLRCVLNLWSIRGRQPNRESRSSSLLLERLEIRQLLASDIIRYAFETAGGISGEFSYDASVAPGFSEPGRSEYYSAGNSLTASGGQLDSPYSRTGMRVGVYDDFGIEELHDEFFAGFVDEGRAIRIGLATSDLDTFDDTSSDQNLDLSQFEIRHFAYSNGSIFSDTFTHFEDTIVRLTRINSDKLDIKVNEFKFISDMKNVTFKYEIANKALKAPGTIEAFWSTSDSPTGQIVKDGDMPVPLVFRRPTKTPVGMSPTLTIPAAALAGRPKNATHLVLSIATNEQEVDKDNNVASISLPVVDLVPAVVDNKVVPTAAKDLNLSHFWGYEKLTIPVELTNSASQSLVNGSTTLSLYISPKPTIGLSAVKLLVKEVTQINLATGEKKQLSFEVTVPASFVAGNKYYIIATTVPSGLDSPDSKARTSVPTRTIEFVGTPLHPELFTSGLYFNLVRDTLKNDTSAAVRQDGAINVSDFKSFTGAFEGSHRYAYLDTAKKKNPTIGIGVNLNTLSASLRKMLVADVRKYYATHYPNQVSKLPTNEVGVIELLKSQARADSRTVVLEVEDDNAIFEVALREHEKRAIAGLPVYSSLSNIREKVAIVDQVYNGVLFTSMNAPLAKGDYVLAGIKMFDQLQTSKGWATVRPRGVEKYLDGQVLRRMAAQYQNLLATHKADLGAIISNS